MKNITFHLIFLFILLIFLQVWLFNHIHLFGVATPLLYIYFIVKLPVRMNRNVVILLSALLGFFIDIFGSTFGLSMTVMILIGFFRYYLLKLFAPRDIFDDYVPSFTTFGQLLFLRYAGVITLIHVSLLFSIESLSFFTPGLLLLRITGSFILTFLLIFAFESINI